MKAIYTFWSKPYYNTGAKAFAGFLDEEMFYCSWILSVMTASKYFDKIVLYTDAKGAIMLSKLNLPFDSTHIILDELNHLPVDLWGAPKLLVYSLQKEPYIHMDYDLFWWSKPPIELLHSEYVIECKYTCYKPKEGLAHLVANAEYVPEVLQRIKDKVSYNIGIPGCGLYGGQNPLILAETAKVGLELIDKNPNYINSLLTPTNSIISMSLLNTIIEEYIPRILLNIEWTCLDTLMGGKECHGHMLGEYKKLPSDCSNVKNLVKKEYPQYYNRL